MTALSQRKSKLVVEFSDTVRERGKLREVTMQLYPWGASVRLKGLRGSFDISAASIYNMAVTKKVAADRAEKKARRGK